MRPFVLLLAFLAVPLLARAQVRGGRASGAGHSIIMAPHAASASSYARPQGSGSFAARPPQGHTGANFYTGHRTTGNRPPARGAVIYANGRAGFLPDFTGVPGLGFDWAHYAAVHPGWNRRGLRAGSYYGYFPYFDSGFLLPYGAGYGYAAQPDDQPVYDSQDTVDGPVNGDPATGYGVRPVSSYDVVVTPQTPSQPYVFVRRDGTVFFAVAYSLESGNLDYVTQEGLRRSVALDTLDLNATQQFNEQRGLSFRVPVTS
jgi:hypothetical protein